LMRTELRSPGAVNRRAPCFPWNRSTDVVSELTESLLAPNGIELQTSMLEHSNLLGNRCM
jgi:hypothetical protein